MTLLGIDHIVVIDQDLAGLVARFEQLGFRVTPGGRHPEAQTHNALILFEDGSYIELIAFQGSQRTARGAAVSWQRDDRIHARQ